MRNIIYMSCLLLFGLPSHSIEWLVRNFVTPAGKTFEEVRDITKTDDDAIWFASWGHGIARLDGADWRVFTVDDGLSSNFVPAIENDGRNGVWAATDNGISHITAQGKITTFSPIDLPIMDEPSLNEVKRLKSGEVWFGSDSGSIIAALPVSERRNVDEVDPLIAGDRQWMKIREASAPDGHGIYEILETEDEGIWIAADRGGIFHYHNWRWDRITAESLNAERVRCIARDRNGWLWCVGGAFMFYDNNRWNKVEDIDGQILTASPHGHIFLVGYTNLFHLESGVWENQPFPPEIGSPKARTIYFADENHAWIGTKEGILQVIRARFQDVYHTSLDFKQERYGFTASPESPPLAIIGHYNLAQFNGDTWETVVHMPVDAPDCRWLTRPVNGKLWAYSEPYLYQIDLDEKMITARVMQPDKLNANGTIVLSDERLLIYGDRGLYVYQDGDWRILSASEGDSTEPIQSVSENRDGSLLLCRRTEIERWNGKELKKISFKPIATEVHPLTMALEAGDGTIWTGSRGHGVFVYDGHEVRRLTVDNGLLSDRITLIYEASDGTLWLGSEHLGLSSYKDGRWIQYSHTQGIGSDEISYIGEYPAGVIWLSAAESKLYRYIPDTKPPDTRIERYPATIPHNGFGVFTFHGYDHWNNTQTHNLSYSWRITNHRTGNPITAWSSFAADRSVETPVLPSGEYSFEVRAADLDRNVDNTPTSVWFEILPSPVASRVWFIPVVSFVTLVMFALAMVAVVSRKKLAVYTGNLELEVQKRTADLMNANRQLISEINDRTNLQEILEKNERMYRNAIEIADAVPYSRNHLTGEFDYIGEGIIRLTGYTPEETTSALWRSLTIEERHFDGIMRRSENELDPRHEGEQSMARRADYQIRTKAGNIKWIADSEIRIHGSDGTIIGSLGILQDITERKRIEEEDLKNSKLESVGLLAGGIAHDFNNFLTAFLGNVSLAKQLCVPDSPIWNRLTEAEKASIRAQTLTQQLLTFSKGGLPVRESADVCQIVRETTQFTLVGSNVRYEFHFFDDIWKVTIDRGQFSQVIQNLVLNAKDAMPMGGVVNIHIENLDGNVRGEEPFIHNKDVKYVKISIRDHGVGIDEASINKIFDPYFTTKKEGTGLGLATSYAIVKKHGGTIEVESQPGEGSTFTIYLPCLSGETNELKPTDSSEGAGNIPVISEGRVVVMDDEPMVRDVACGMLEQMGYVAVGAPNGEETLRLVREGIEYGTAFDAVIMDLTIPGGMGGKEAIVKLREIAPEIIAIVSSGYSDDPIMANHRNFGFDAVIGKPYTLEQLDNVLKQVWRAYP